MTLWVERMASRIKTTRKKRQCRTSRCLVYRAQHDYPDHWTQGRDLAELELMLRDIRELTNDGAFNDSPKSIGVMEFA